MSVAEAEAVPRVRHGLEHGSPLDALRVVGMALLPALARGLFVPRRRAMKWLTTLDSDGRAVRALQAVRRRHGGEGVRLLGGKLLLLWGPEAIREVLDESATVWASDAGAKAKGMSHFQPDALTLSRGDEWRDRRAFTETVLATSERVHPFGDRFVAVVDDEVDRLRVGDELAWEHWERLFDRLTLRVIFGDRSRCDQDVTDLLEKLMHEANRIVALSESDRYHELYGQLERHLRDPEPGSLVARFAEAPQTDRTRVVHQIPHWIFAMRDTLAANAFRALAAIVADPELERRVREEIEAADLSDARAIDALRTLEGCLSEAMRLWPTTPLLAREAIRDTTVAGERVAAGTQAMIFNPLNHRDEEHVEAADRVEPGRWSDGERDYRFNHLSNGAQDCPGGALVELLGKAAIARTLAEWKLELREPELPAGGAQPSMLDFFRIRFAAERRG